MGAFIDVNATIDATNKMRKDAVPKTLDEFASQVVKMSGERISPQAKIDDLLQHAYGKSAIQSKRAEINDAIASQNDRAIFKFAGEILESFKPSRRRGGR